MRRVSESCDSILVTEKSEFQVRDFCRKQYYVPQINRRELLFLPKFAALFLRANRILKKENPDYVITTGALIAYPFCVLAKRKKKKVIYIESFARVYQPSLTGKLVHRYADLFFVQWEDMLEIFPDATLGGGLF